MGGGVLLLGLLGLGWWGGRMHRERGELQDRYDVLFDKNQAGVFRTTVDGAILDCNRALFKQNVAGAFRSRLDGELFEVNPAFTKMLGYESPDQLEGRELKETSAAELRFSAEVVEVRPKSPDSGADEVEVSVRGDDGRETVTARFVAGCDGAHSTVRRSLAASFEGETYGLRAALADVRLRDDRTWRFPRLTTRHRLAVAIRLRPPSTPGDGGLRGLALLGRSPFLKPALRSASLALRVPGVRRRVLRRLAMLDRTA